MPTLAVDLVTDKPVQGATPPNADNRFTTGRQASVAKEPTMFMALSEVEAMLGRENGKRHHS